MSFDQAQKPLNVSKGLAIVIYHHQNNIESASDPS
jgi:hypothetical protein